MSLSCTSQSLSSAPKRTEGDAGTEGGTEGDAGTECGTEGGGCRWVQIQGGFHTWSGNIEKIVYSRQITAKLMLSDWRKQVKVKANIARVKCKLDLIGSTLVCSLAAYVLVYVAASLLYVCALCFRVIVPLVSSYVQHWSQCSIGPSAALVCLRLRCVPRSQLLPSLIPFRLHWDSYTSIMNGRSSSASPCAHRVYA